MIRKNNVIYFIILTIFYNCGTGPWFINKNIYSTYKEPIYRQNKLTISTNGYYLQIGELKPNNSSRNLIIFFEDGYVTSLNLLEKDFNNELKQKVTNREDTLKVDLDWWKVENDSISIEHYGSMKRQMYTWNYFQKGRIMNDSIIELRYDDSIYPATKYKFVKTDSLPKVLNIGKYLDKDWYREKRHKERKNISKTTL